MKLLLAELRKPLFWFFLLVFLAGVYLHYSQYFFQSVSEHPGIERIFFLIIVIFSSLFVGFASGAGYLILSAIAMIPYPFIYSDNITIDLIEIIVVIAAGLGFILWFRTHYRNISSKEESLLKLKAVQNELETYVNTARENEKRLSVLHSITATVNQYSNLANILTTSIDKIMEAIDVDGVLIYLIDNTRNQLELRHHKGISAEFSRGADHVKIGEGFNGRVAQTGQPTFIENSSSDPRMARDIVKKEEIASQFIVPLTAQEKVVGTLCTLSHSIKNFTKDDQQLLILIGTELGVAIERAALSEEKERAGKRYKDLFEKAHDAIWLQDLEGKILTANQELANITGYSLKQLIGSNVSRYLAPEALELAREFRRKLLAGIEVEQPYEQKVIKNDGTEATMMLTTSLIKEEDNSYVFQHISRDVTREKLLTENLRLYAHQITRAQEDERKRVARELHDDSIQTLIILSRHVDELISEQSKNSKLIQPLEELRLEINNVIAQIRIFTQDLRPPTLDYLGLIPAIRELVSQFEQKSKIKATFQIQGNPAHFTPESEMLIYRVIQEALNNIWKHSEAKSANVFIDYIEDKAVIKIIDDGEGFSPADETKFVQTGKIGLASMRERTDLLGGSLAITSETGKGTTVTLTAPYERWQK